jgi:polar amino acid transport system substrate-binding protein
VSKLFDKRDFLRLLSSAAVAAPTAAVVASKGGQKNSGQSENESAYERVMRTKTIRCGYDVWPPIIVKDLNSGRLSGIFYDYMEALGKNLGLKIEWINGISYGNYISELHYNHIDAMCAGVWPVGEVITSVDFTSPLYYIEIDTYVRADDFRFDKDLSALNDPRYTIASIDGLIPARIANADFPKAKVMSLPQASPPGDMLLSVADGKADATFTDTLTASDYIKHNPGKLRKVAAQRPIRIFGNTMAVAKNQDALLRMLNYATEELQNSGAIESIVQKYEKMPGVLLMQKTEYK